MTRTHYGTWLLHSGHVSSTVLGTLADHQHYGEVCMYHQPTHGNLGLLCMCSCPCKQYQSLMRWYLKPCKHANPQVYHSFFRLLRGGQPAKGGLGHSVNIHG